MKTKLIFLIITLFSISSAIFGQASEEQIKMVQEKFEKDKKEVVANYIDLNDPENIDFWNFYADYELHRKEIEIERFKLLMNFNNNQLVYDDSDFDKDIKKFIAVKDDTDDLIEKYYNKIKRKYGAKMAAKFYMIERYFQSVVRENFMKKIPFINELESK